MILNAPSLFKFNIYHSRSKVFFKLKKKNPAVNKLFPAYLVVPLALNEFASYGLESHL